MENLEPRNEQNNVGAPRLGFHEIVPGYDGGNPQGQARDSQIPAFDLNGHLMAEERRESSLRRQGPGQKRAPVQVIEPVGSAETVPKETVNKVSAAIKARVSVSRHPAIQRHAIIEDIVRRDIQRLCRGPQTV